jgi:transposase
MVFMDTTSLYFEGACGQTLGCYGYSKDHRPDLRQMILAVVIDGDGRPVCSEMWPGNTADVTTLIPVIDRLQARFAIARVCVVADRGLISADTVAELEARRLLYILGVRERSDKLVRELVLKDAGPLLAIEALMKLINGDVRSQSKRNVTQSKAFSERLEAAIARYHTNAITTAQVLEEFRSDRARLQGMVTRSAFPWFESYQAASASL